MTEDRYVLEWSHRSGNLHVQPLSRLLSANRRAYAMDAPTPDYVPLYVGTRAECEQAAEAMRHTLAGRAAARKIAADAIATAQEKSR